MVWQAERGGSTKWFCAKCGKRLTADFELNPYGVGLNAVHEMLHKLLIDFKEKIKKLTPKNEQWHLTIAEFAHDAVRIILLLNK